MTTLEMICEKAAQLPKKGQGELLVYAEFLFQRYSKSTSRVQEEQWSIFSMQSALDSIPDEESSGYDDVEFKEKWK